MKGAGGCATNVFALSIRVGMKRERWRISVIGAGRLGTAMALALAARGYQIEAFVTRRKGHAERARRLLRERDPAANPRALSAAQLTELPACDLLLIATPDDEIKEVARSLASALPSGPSGGVALHTSGALSSEELRPLREAGWRVGSLHPLVSISDARSGAGRFAGAFFCLEGERSALKAGRRIAHDLGGFAFSIPPEKKALYHAAAVIASGHTAALFSLALELFQRCGLRHKEAQRALIPLLRSTVDNLSAKLPARAMTGTFARGDVETVKRHLAVLSAQPEALEIYRLLGLRALRLAAPSAREEIESLLRLKGKVRRK